MAEYKSRFIELGFYVDGKRRQFNGGRYVTEDPKETAVLDALTDAERVDQPAKVEKTEEPEAPAKPARKSSGK